MGLETLFEHIRARTRPQVVLTGLPEAPPATTSRHDFPFRSTIYAGAISHPLGSRKVVPSGAKSEGIAGGSLDLPGANWGVTGLTEWRRHLTLKRTPSGEPAAR